MNTLNMDDLKWMFISGANNLSNNYKEVDALNVFPIPDGDTGTNMMMTIQSGINEIQSVEEDSVGVLATTFSKGLLLGARRNSGVILSQIFKGFGDAIKEKQKLALMDFALAFQSGKEKAYKAVLKPVEGTMLTVIRESSEALLQFLNENKKVDFVDAMDFMVKEAHKSLENTPNLLPVLKEANVIDSGGAGILKILEGFLAALQGNAITLNEQKPTSSKNVLFEPIEDKEDDFGYCTEFILNLNEGENKKEYHKEELQSFLESIGNSIVLVQDENLVKVHVHTLTPGKVLEFAQQYGEFYTLKIENMDVQHEGIKKAKKERKKQAIVTVAVGKGLTKIFKDLRADVVISGGQTMNPSIEDFVKEIRKLNPESVIILPNNSNIIMSARQAADILNKEGIVAKVVPTTSIQQGITAFMGFNPECEIDDNIVEMMAAIKRVTCGQVTYAVRDSRLNGVTIKSGDYIGIKEKKIISASKDIVKVSCALIDSMMGYDSEIVTILTGSDIAKKHVNAIKKYINEKYKQVEVEVNQGDQPVYYLLLSVE